MSGTTIPMPGLRHHIPAANRVLVWLGWAIILVGPVLLLGLFRFGQIPDPSLAGPVFHFYLVTTTSFLVLTLAIVMRYAAGQLNDPRALFLSLSFLAIAGIFLVHALTTPGVLVENNPWVGFSARLSTFAGAALLFTSTITWAPRPRTMIIRNQRRITIGVAAFLICYGVLAVTTAALNAYPFQVSTVLTGEVGSSLITSFTIVMLGYVIYRYARIYSVSRTPLVVGILISSILLAQSKLSMVTAPIWNASWWEYHALLLIGFFVALVTLGWEYQKSRSVEGVVGGLFLRDSVAQVKRGYTDVIVALIEAVEAKDHYTRGHTQRVAELSMLIGEQLGLPADQRRILSQSAVLHDIGKIGIPDAVLNKPGKLTDEEFDLIKEHPVRGYRMIRHVASLRPESEGVRYHHERLDGGGYPDGLVGNEIPLIPRIIAVADVFDALTSPRPYRGAFSVDQAVAVLREESGPKLDPACVSALLNVLPVWSHRMSTAIPEQPASLRRIQYQPGVRAASD